MITEVAADKCVTQKHALRSARTALLARGAQAALCAPPANSCLQNFTERVGSFYRADTVLQTR